MFALPVCAPHHPYVSLAERSAVRTSHVHTDDTHTAPVQALKDGMEGFYSYFFFSAFRDLIYTKPPKLWKAFKKKCLACCLQPAAESGALLDLYVWK